MPFKSRTSRLRDSIEIRERARQKQIERDSGNGFFRSRTRYRVVKQEPQTVATYQDIIPPPKTPMVPIVVEQPVTFQKPFPKIIVAPAATGSDEYSDRTTPIDIGSGFQYIIDKLTGPTGSMTTQLQDTRAKASPIDNIDNAGGVGTTALYKDTEKKDSEMPYNFLSDIYGSLTDKLSDKDAQDGFTAGGFPETQSKLPTQSNVVPIVQGQQATQVAGFNFTTNQMLIAGGITLVVFFAIGRRRR